jgi:hypothetical protein
LDFRPIGFDVNTNSTVFPEPVDDKTVEDEDKDEGAGEPKNEGVEDEYRL